MSFLTRLSARIDAMARLPLTIGVALAQLAVLVPVAVARGIDGDEGYYTLASALVAQGKLPYEDFFYPQMPLLPLVYGPWTLLFGESWTAVRLLSVLCAAGAGVLLFRHVAARFRSQSAGVLAVALYGSSMLVLLWMTVVKTYPLSTLLLVGAFVLADRPELEQAARRWLLSGLLLGLALDARLIVASTVPVFLVYAWRAGGRRLAGAHVAGLAIGLLPALVFFALDPRRFYFHNLGYHSVRSPGGLFGSVSAKADMLGELARDHPQFVVLLVVVIAGLVATWRLRRPLGLALPVAGVLAVAGLAPNPPFVQDYSTLVPFLVVAAVEVVVNFDALAAALAGRERVPVLRWALVAALAFCLAVPFVELPRNTRDGYLGGGDFIADTLRPSTVRAVTRAIDAHARPGEQVLSYWPGYLFGSHAEPVPGFENDFGPQGVKNAGYSDAEADRYLLLSPHRLDQLVSGRRVRVIAIGALGDWTKRHRSIPLIVSSGYRQVGLVGVTRILERGRPGPERAIQGCLRSAGLRPELGPPVRDVAVLNVPLPAGATARLFVYPGEAQARAAAPEVAGFLRLRPEDVAVAGPAVIAYSGAPGSVDARGVEACARRPDRPSGG